MLTQRFKFANYRVLFQIFHDIDDLCIAIKLGFCEDAIFHPYKGQNSNGSTATYRDTWMTTTLIICVT